MQVIQELTFTLLDKSYQLKIGRSPNMMGYFIGCKIKSEDFLDENYDYVEYFPTKEEKESLLKQANQAWDAYWTVDHQGNSANCRNPNRPSNTWNAATLV